MAESQEHILYDPALLQALESALSKPRFLAYVEAAKGDRKLATNLYLWNSRISKSFLFPLNIAEVSMRNAMHFAFSQEFGGTWIFNPPFALTAESEASRQKALLRLQDHPSADDVVAALTFDFWSNLFRREYRALWERPGLLNRTFPHLPTGHGRHEVQLRVAAINRLRNRIAHHEPVHTLDHRAEHDNILGLIALRCPTLKDWVRRCSTVMAVVRTPPSVHTRLPGLPLSSTNLRKPLILMADTSLLTVIDQIASARPAIALVQVPTSGLYAISSAQILSFIAKKSGTLDGMVDLGAHTLGEVIADTPSLLTSDIDRNASTGDALAAFFPSGTPQDQRPQALIVKAGHAVHGVIVHPLIRYS